MFKPQFPSAAPSSLSTQDHSGSSKQVYNNPIGLYSNENVAEVTKLNKMGLSALPASPSGLLHPNKIQQVVLTPAKDYNPKDSATWQALQESDPTITDPEKLKNFTSLREHDPIFSEVYSAQKHKSTSPQPIPPKARESNLNPMSNSSAPGQPVPSSLQAPARSPVADLLPPKFGGKAEPKPELTSSEEQQQSAVLAAALAESKPVDPNAVAYDMEGLPLFETNSIGGRKKISQSASFNKLMMNVLGD